MSVIGYGSKVPKFSVYFNSNYGYYYDSYTHHGRHQQVTITFTDQVPLWVMGYCQNLAYTFVGTLMNQSTVSQIENYINCILKLLISDGLLFEYCPGTSIWTDRVGTQSYQTPTDSIMAAQIEDLKKQLEAERYSLKMVITQRDADRARVLDLESKQGK